MAGRTTPRDRRAAAAAVAAYSLSLAITAVAVPLLIVEAGYGLSQVGLFLALSALAQTASRVRIGAVLRRVPDKQLVLSAAGLLALSCGLLAWSAWWPLVLIAMLLQGLSRGLFWTGVQTHAVRITDTAARGMAGVNLAAGAGQVVGPVVAGLLLEQTAAAAMVAAATVALLAAVPAALLKRLAPFGGGQAPPTTRVTRRPEVRTAVWAGAVCGGWRGLMGTYAPVLLQQAGHAASAIGIAVAAANVATIAAGWLARWLRAALVRPAMAAGMLAGGAGLGLAAVTADWWAAATLGLVVSGLGIGLLQTIGPAAASDAVPADDRGDAIAAVGLYRAGALFVAPFGVAGLLLVMPVGPAVAVAGGLLALPAVSGRSGTARRRSAR